MKIRIVSAACALLVAGGALLALRTQEGFQAPKPSKEHEFLKQMEGTWDSVVKMMMDPTKPPIESKGVETSVMGGNGLWLISDVKGEFLGQPFHGHGMMGYDTMKKKFVGCWVDSMGTYIAQSEGSCDAEGKTFTMTMEMPDPASGKTVKMKEVHVVKGRDMRHSTMTMVGPDGKEMTVMTIESKRRK